MFVKVKHVDVKEERKKKCRVRVKVEQVKTTDDFTSRGLQYGV